MARINGARDFDSYLFVVGRINLLLDLAIPQEPPNLQVQVFEYAGVTSPKLTSQLLTTEVCNVGNGIASQETPSNIPLEEGTLYEIFIFLPQGVLPDFSCGVGTYQIRLAFRGNT